MKDVADLSPDIQAVSQALVEGLKTILGDDLCGIYLYGASVFDDSGPVQDFDCHVILASALSDQERAAISSLHGQVGERFPPLGAEIDAYYITLEAARSPDPPQHQLNLAIHDDAWALHCAHVQAGYYIALFGPVPGDIFPPPNWDQLEQALDHELDFVQANLRYPAYCILNLCRILYSFRTGDVAVSKRFGGRWFQETYPEFTGLIEAAIRHYDRAATPEDEQSMARELPRFMTFVETNIQKARPRRSERS